MVQKEGVAAAESIQGIGVDTIIIIAAKAGVSATVASTGDGSRERNSCCPSCRSMSRGRERSYW